MEPFLSKPPADEPHQGPKNHRSKRAKLKPHITETTANEYFFNPEVEVVDVNNQLTPLKLANNMFYHMLL